MDYVEEQSSEIEALQSIYVDELEIIAEEPFPVFNISIKSNDYEEGEGILCLLRFEFTEKYPDEMPVIQIEETENISDEDNETLKEFLNEQARENLGMAMIFTLVSSAQEWINDKSDFLIKEREENEVRKKYEREEAERKKFEGTRVTFETFAVWKKAFEIEMGLNLKREKEDKIKKLTGRELFLLDKSLNESDLKFLEEGEIVQVDESLFQDFDDMGLDSPGSDDYPLELSNQDLCDG